VAKVIAGFGGAAGGFREGVGCLEEVVWVG